MPAVARRGPRRVPVEGALLPLLPRVPRGAPAPRCAAGLRPGRGGRGGGPGRAGPTASAAGASCSGPRGSAPLSSRGCWRQAPAGPAACGVRRERSGAAAGRAGAEPLRWGRADLIPGSARSRKMAHPLAGGTGWGEPSAVSVRMITGLLSAAALSC